MNLNIPDHILSLRPYVPGKPIEETQREFKLKKVIKLASNENPIGPSPMAVQAARTALKEAHRYPDGSAYHLKKALAKKLKLQPEHLLIGNGSNEVIDMIIRTYSNPGDSILTSQAAFIAYRICAQVHGVKTSEVPLTSDLRFDVEAAIRTVREDESIKILFLANPNNPTGTHNTKDEIDTLVRELKEIRGGSTILVLDYAYWEYVNSKEIPDALNYLSVYSNLIVLRTFSKAYGLPGFRVGYGVASSDLIGFMERIREPFNVNSIGLAAAEAALKDREYLRKGISVNREGRKAWEKFLSKNNVPFWKSQGNFLLVDVQSEHGITGQEVYDACLRKGVIFRPVANYGLPGALRISIGTPAENKIAMKVFAEVLGLSQSK